MHPILARFERLAAYLGVWLLAGGLVAVLISRQGISWPETLVLLLPPLVVYAFVCLSAWYVCRATPLGSTRLSAVLAAAGAAAVIAGTLWLVLNESWLALLESVPAVAAVTARFRPQIPFLFAGNVMLFLLVLSVHYVALAFEAVRTAERQQLELQVLTHEAELRALRAQIDPHFLYNSLNSISALTGSDAVAARRMCLLLAEFLRMTLNVSSQSRIAITEELLLADRFLDIEQVRFGSRLQVERHIDADAAQCRVPPLVLQPLLENAVAHGIAGLLDGGVIRLDVTRQNGRLSIAVENPRDPEAQPHRRGSRVGLENVRRRLSIVFGGTARLDTIAAPDRFRVVIDLPCVTDD